jgi:GNAT superfamily N-acetyltransferase
VSRSKCQISRANACDASMLASLHTESWRAAYRGLLPDDFLNGPVAEELRTLWDARMTDASRSSAQVFKATVDGLTVGLACVLVEVEPAWGPRLDNLHVKPGFKGQGIGWRLFVACHKWVRRQAPGQPMHLWVIEGNHSARQSYERQGGEMRDRRTIEIAPGVTVPELRYVWTAP